MKIQAEPSARLNPVGSHQTAKLVPVDPDINEEQAMLHLMNIEYEPTNVVQTRTMLEAASGWIDKRVRADNTLGNDTRKDPGSVNLLHRVLSDDELTTIEHKEALAFADMVKGFTNGGSANDPAAAAAAEIAEGIRQLTNDHETLHLTLA